MPSSLCALPSALGTVQMGCWTLLGASTVTEFTVVF